MKTCYIVGAGDFTARDFHPEKEDLLIAADGGFKAVQALGFTPGLLMGDFDSLGCVPQALPGKTRVLRYAVEKDDTDTGLALAQGFAEGYRRFLLYGCGGGRLDHLLANQQLMCQYEKAGAQVRLVDPDYDLYALHNEALTLPFRPPETLVSVFCHGDRAQGVTLQGLQYPLENATLTCDRPLGVSNHYTREEARVSVKEGTLLVMVFWNRR